MAGEHTIVVTIRLDTQQWLAYYRQPNARVQARAHDGRLIELPASLLQRFVSHAGVSGTFRLSLDAQHKLLDITKI